MGCWGRATTGVDWSRAGVVVAARAVGCAYDAVGNRDSPPPSVVISGRELPDRMEEGSVKASGKRGCDPLLSASLSHV